ncbi:cytochrome b [Aquabacterium fontiphilum]|jgi:cytochrome b561|uniref:cytochrome b n=1 Tax=Aquabacterium fontiphilum TaxID=450365 RepID=UPI001377D670|nr:cytochrome b [Aquabacterium fontiphilum]NBD19142.1 cytochrome b [Aquabacterium fontiphilum]
MKHGESPADPRYSTPAIVLHWVLALGIVGAFAMGWYLSEQPFSLSKLKLINWHKWAGITILALSVLRLLWRLTHRPPALPARVVGAMPRWQQAAHHGVHHLLYGLFFAVPLLGWAASSAKGFPIVWFGVLPLPDWVGVDQELGKTLQGLHAWAAWGLIALAGLHVAAALKHQLVDRDGLMARMLPRR